MNRSFSHILLPLSAENKECHEIIPAHSFERATQEQIKLIRRTIINEGSEFSPFIYEGERTPDDLSGNLSHELSKDESLWRYWVISYDKESEQIENLKLALLFCEPSIEVGLDGLWIDQNDGIGGYAVRFHPESLYAFLRYAARKTDSKSALLAQDYWPRVAELVNALEALVKTHPNVKRSIELYISSLALPRGSAMRTLALFAIIESVITHKPSIAFDSLNHQVNTKMLLLGKRFVPPLDYSSFDASGKTLTPKMIWTSLYSFRSAIAHGEDFDFQKGDGAKLKDFQTAFHFVETVTCRLIRQAILEPDLIQDLKAC